MAAFKTVNWSEVSESAKITIRAPELTRRSKDAVWFTPFSFCKTKSTGAIFLVYLPHGLNHRVESGSWLEFHTPALWTPWRIILLERDPSVRGCWGCRACKVKKSCDEPCCPTLSLVYMRANMFQPICWTQSTSDRPYNTTSPTVLKK